MRDVVDITSPASPNPQRNSSLCAPVPPLQTLAVILYVWVKSAIALPRRHYLLLAVELELLLDISIIYKTLLFFLFDDAVELYTCLTLQDVLLLSYTGCV